MQVICKGLRSPSLRPQGRLVRDKVVEMLKAGVSYETVPQTLKTKVISSDETKIKRFCLYGKVILVVAGAVGRLFSSRVREAGYSYINIFLKYGRDCGCTVT